MILWSIQHKEDYELLLKTGYLRCNHIQLLRTMEYPFIQAYEWMAEQMENRISISPKGIRFPIWAWYQWEGKRKQPDLRVHGRGWSEKGTHLVLLTIDAPDECVLLSDFDNWHFVINNEPLTNDNSAIHSEEEKKKSWENIFISNKAISKSTDSLSIQATLWEIKAEWVLNIKHFISR